MVERLESGEADRAFTSTSSDNILQEDNQSPRFPNRSFSETPIPPRENDPSAISLLAKDCLQRFQNICNILQSSEPSENDQNGVDRDLALLTMLDARARFKAWGGSIAAFHDGLTRTSLDFRLREASGMRRRALQILEYLQEYLHEATMIIAGEKSNEKWGSVSESSDESAREEIDSDDRKKEDKQKQRGERDQDGQTSELQELFSAIYSSNASLMKLSMVIRSSPTRDDYLKAALRYKDWNPYPDIGHVKEKHGSAKRSTDWLLQRLGKGIARRRQFLKYRVDHFEKLSGDLDDQKAGKEDEKPGRTIASTKATTFLGKDNAYQRKGSDTAGSFGSQTSYEATVLGDENTSNRLTVPPPPKLAFPDISFEFGEPFNCPYCYTEQNVKNKAAWKKHVFRDLKPYICTFKGCDMMMFRSRNEWFAHELHNHRRKWTCQFCQHGAFTTSAAFSKHISSSHPEALGSSQLEALLLQNEEAVDTISASACPLCDEWETNITARKGKQDPGLKVLNDGEALELHGTRNQFRRHLGRHMEQLALFALPMSEIVELDDDSTDEDQDDDSDHISKASEDHSLPVGSVTEPATMLTFSSPEIQAKEKSRGIPLPPAPEAVPQSTETYEDDEGELYNRINRGSTSPVPVANFEHPSSPIPEPDPDPRRKGFDYYDDDEIEVTIHRNRGRAEPQPIYYQHGNSYVVPSSSSPANRPLSVDRKQSPPPPFIINNSGYESFDNEVKVDRHRGRTKPQRSYYQLDNSYVVPSSSGPLNRPISVDRKQSPPPPFIINNSGYESFDDEVKVDRHRGRAEPQRSYYQLDNSYVVPSSSGPLNRPISVDRKQSPPPPFIINNSGYESFDDEDDHSNPVHLQRSSRQRAHTPSRPNALLFGYPTRPIRSRSGSMERKSKDGRPKKTQEELDAEMEAYWVSKNGTETTAATTAAAPQDEVVREERQLRSFEEHEAVTRYEGKETEKTKKQKEDDEESEKEYRSRLEEDLRKMGMDERQIAIATEKKEDVAPERAKYTRMSRRHLSIETLNKYRIDYQLDTDADYVLIKRRVPEYEQDFLFSHTREIRDKRRLPPPLPPAEGSKTQFGGPEYEVSGKKKRYKPSPSPLERFLAGGRRNEGKGAEKKT